MSDAENGAPAGIDIHEPWCKGCYICIEVCPREVFALSERVAEKGFCFVDVAGPERCNECLLCELMCPDLAIRVLLAW